MSSVKPSPRKHEYQCLRTPYRFDRTSTQPTADGVDISEIRGGASISSQGM